MNLRPGAWQGFETPLVEFRTKDSDTLGRTGDKFYGYRVKFYYKNTLVRVVAQPNVLRDWQGSDTTQ